MVTLIDIILLSDFLNKKGIKFVLTGTAALSVHGLIPKGYDVGDIDILVSLTPDVETELKLIANLTGGNYDDYDGKSFAFYFGKKRIKVNAIAIKADEPTYIKMVINSIPVYDESNTLIKATSLNLHTADEILKAKFALNRNKDYAFCNNLIATLVSYFKK